MRRLWTKIVGFGVMAVLLLPEIVAAAGPKAAPLCWSASHPAYTFSLCHRRNSALGRSIAFGSTASEPSLTLICVVITGEDPAAVAMTSECITLKFCSMLWKLAVFWFSAMI